MCIRRRIGRRSDRMSEGRPLLNLNLGRYRPLSTGEGESLVGFGEGWETSPPGRLGMPPARRMPYGYSIAYLLARRGRGFLSHWPAPHLTLRASPAEDLRKGETGHPARYPIGALEGLQASSKGLSDSLEGWDTRKPRICLWRVFRGAKFPDEPCNSALWELQRG